MSSSAWLRVAAGFQRVASAAVSQSTQQVNMDASRAALHGVEVLQNTRLAAQAAMQQEQENVKSTNSSTVNNKNTIIDSNARRCLSEQQIIMEKEQQLSKVVSTGDQTMQHINGATTSVGSVRRINPSFKREKKEEVIFKTEYHPPVDAPDGAGPHKNVSLFSKEENDEASKHNNTAAAAAVKQPEDLSHDKTLVPPASRSADGTTLTIETATKREKEEETTPEQEQEQSIVLQNHINNNNNNRFKEGRPVPSTRVGRAVGFAGLGVGLVFGTAAELAGRIIGNSGSTDSSNLVASDANADRLAASLCRMRGAALKLGQMLSIQDESMLPPALARALRKVRQGADSMPQHQLLQQLESQLGTNWKDLLSDFNHVPFAAASIGQVHKAVYDNSKVVLKVQYPGVADSIDADLNNLQTLVKFSGLAPPGLFLDNVIRVGRTELKQECNYLLEAQNQQRFQELVHNDDVLRENKFVVPSVIPELTTNQVLTSEFAPGGTIDKVSFLNQDERNRIARNILRLTMQELFVWRFMQTDPNWGNFLYDVGTSTTYLIDFGAAREYSKEFVNGYLRIVWAAANRDGDTIMEQSHDMGFLTGDENEIMLNAHKASGFTVGEPFRTDKPFDFRGSNISSRLSKESSVFLQHRLTPPPEEVYTLHRKLAGAYMLCIKLGAVINCREVLEEVMDNHVFEDEKAPPVMNYSEDVEGARMVATGSITRGLGSRQPTSTNHRVDIASSTMPQAQ